MIRGYIALIYEILRYVMEAFPTGEDSLRNKLIIRSTLSRSGNNQKAIWKRYDE